MWGVLRLKVRVGKRFTITIPKEAREKLGIREGCELEVIVTGDSIILRKPRSLVEFIEDIEPRGSAKVLLDERSREIETEGERIDEFIKGYGNFYFIVWS